MSKPNSVVWFEIYVQDMARARAFYEQVLAVQLEALQTPGDEMEMYTFPSQMEAPGAAGALVKTEGVSSGAGGTLVYFHSEDCAVEAARIVAAGGSVHQAKMSIGPYGFIALGMDTEGNMFGLHSMQ